MIKIEYPDDDKLTHLMWRGKLKSVSHGETKEIITDNFIVNAITSLGYSEGLFYVNEIRVSYNKVNKYIIYKEV